MTKGFYMSSAKYGTYYFRSFRWEVSGKNNFFQENPGGSCAYYP